MLEQVYAAVHGGRTAEARALLEAAPVLLASVEGRHALGYALAHGGFHDGARAVYASLRNQHTGQPAEHLFVHQLGMVERLAGEFRAALRLFEEERALVEKLPEAERPWRRAVNGYEVGVCHLALGEVGEARAALNSALADARAAGDPMTLGCVHRALGDFAAHVGDLDTARDEYDRAGAALEDAGDGQAAAEVRGRRDGLER